MTNLSLVQVKIDVEPLLEAADRIAGMADDFPYIMAGLLNDAAFKARQVFIQDTWPTHVTQRNSAFMRASWRVVKKATKADLMVVLADTLGHAHLALHAKGGSKTPKVASRLAIPVPDTVHYTAHGIRKSERPRALIETTSKRALRVNARGIFVGKGGKLTMRYLFKASANQPADVPFQSDWTTVVHETIRTGFVDACRKASKTRAKHLAHESSE